MNQNIPFLHYRGEQFKLLQVSFPENVSCYTCNNNRSVTELLITLKANITIRIWM